MSVIDLWQTVASVLADNLYLVLGTTDAAGKPWVSPVFFAARDENLLYWVSSPDSRHSRNIDVQPTVAITVFDSRAAIGVGEAVYMTATASALGAAAGAVGLDSSAEATPVSATTSTLPTESPRHQGSKRERLGRSHTSALGVIAEVQSHGIGWPGRERRGLARSQSQRVR